MTVKEKRDIKGKLVDYSISDEDIASNLAGIPNVNVKAISEMRLTVDSFESKVNN